MYNLQWYLYSDFVFQVQAWSCINNSFKKISLLFTNCYHAQPPPSLLLHSPHSQYSGHLGPWNSIKTKTFTLLISYSLICFKGWLAFNTVFE